MENEIKVGDWIRTNWGHIGKLKRIELDKNDKSLKWYVFDHKEFETNIIKEEYINKPYIVKHSSNLIDLIQCGDYVNGYCVAEIEKDKNGNITDICYEEEMEMQLYSVGDIETIVTKEQIKAMEYRVGG